MANSFERKPKGNEMTTRPNSRCVKTGGHEMITKPNSRRAKEDREERNGNEAKHRFMKEVL